MSIRVALTFGYLASCVIFAAYVSFTVVAIREMGWIFYAMLDRDAKVAVDKAEDLRAERPRLFVVVAAVFLTVLVALWPVVLAQQLVSSS